MLKKFAWWFTCFVLSLLMGEFGWIDQGRAFLYVYLVFIALVFIWATFKILRKGVVDNKKLSATIASILIAFGGIMAVAVMLFAAWGATKLVQVDYFVAFQIMTFGACLSDSSSNNQPKKKSL